jgi:ASC-1-like (ASCH) protein
MTLTQLDSVHSMQLDTIYFDYILNGDKEYETRVFDEKRKKIKLLDVVKFSDKESDRTFKAIITELSWFSNFRDAISEVGIRKVLPNARTLEDGVSTYENFDGGNYKKNSEKFGVLRMKFSLL